MAIINLRKHYYPLYTKDTFVEVPDEVAAVMEECRLYENRQEGRKVTTMFTAWIAAPALRTTLCSWCSPRKI